MKKKVFSFMVVGLICFAAIHFTACDKSKDPVDDDTISGTVSGHFNLSKAVAGENGQATVSRIPQSVNKFMELRDQIGKTPQGVIALYYVAMEMYRVNERIGEECLSIVCVPTLRDYENPKRLSESSRKLLKERLRMKSSGESLYAPWMTMAYWQGAQPDGSNNTYVASAPYTILVEVKGTLPYQKTSFGGLVMYMHIVTPNAKSGHVNVAVKQPDLYEGDGFFMIENNANLLSTAGIYFPRENR